MKWQRNVLQMKEEGKVPEEELSKVQISSQTDKEFKAMVLKMFKELRRRMDEYNEKFNKELENIK